MCTFFFLLLLLLGASRRRSLPVFHAFTWKIPQPWRRRSSIGLLNQQTSTGSRHVRTSCFSRVRGGAGAVPERESLCNPVLNRNLWAPLPRALPDRTIFGCTNRTGNLNRLILPFRSGECLFTPGRGGGSS